jgi:hypothetical protein
MTATGRNTDLITVITDARRELEGLLTEVEVGTTSPEHRRQLADHLITELVANAVAEEQYLYPAVRQYLPDGEQIAKAALAAHAEAEQVMTTLQNMSPVDSRFELSLSKLIADTRKHIDDDLPSRLNLACPAAELRELGKKFCEARQNAPGRPHPSAEERKPGALILNPGDALVEKVRAALVKTGKTH